MMSRRILFAGAKYATAVAVVAAAAVLTRLLRNHGDSGISPLFFAAVLISAWFGGLGPGLLATVLSGVATAYLLFPYPNSLVRAQDAVLRVLVFMVVAMLVSALHAAMRRAAEAMRRARDAAEEASAAKTRFLATVSHELRTPLNSVLMIAESMRDNGALPRPIRNDVDSILRCVELEARLIDDLVDLSRIGSGKLSLDFKPVDLHEPLAEAIRFSAPDARERQLELATDLRATDSRIVGDPVRLQQIFWNLIRNAIKFTPEGGRITVRSFNAGPDAVIVEVSDTGIGIDPDRLSSIFRAFEQGGPDITARFGGLGLGLSIVQALAEAHGATVRAASGGANQGATFTVSFPIAREVAMPADTSRSPGTPGEGWGEGSPRDPAYSKSDARAVNPLPPLSRSTGRG
jgi:signal transduction histidine kinase